MSEQRSPSDPEALQRIEDVERLFETNDTLSVALCEAGKPWIGKVFFVEDEPEPGRLDLCCSIVATAHNVDAFSAGAQVAFLAGGDEPDRWVQGSGVTELLDDDADTDAVFKRLRDKSPAGARFLDRLAARAVRIHVQRLRIVDLDADPPIAEFTFS